MIDTSGTVTWSADHLPFGEAVNETHPENDPGVRYPGQWTVPEAEGLGLPEMYYNGFRWYRAGWGRYLEADPIGLRGGVNLFGYANGNSLRFVDPFGLESCDGPCPECPGKTWFFYGVEAGGVVQVGPLGYGANFAVFEAKCLTSKRTCLFGVACVRGFGLAAFLGGSGGVGLVFNAPCSADIEGWSGGGDIDIAEGGGISVGGDLGSSGTLSGRFQGTVGFGGAATYNHCKTTKIGCRN